MAQVIWAAGSTVAAPSNRSRAPGTNVGVVALVLGVDDLVVVVEHGELNGGGAHVDAQVQVATSVLGVEDRALRGRGRRLWAQRRWRAR